MSVLVGRDTRLLVQGMGKHGTFHAVGCREYGTNVVGGVTPGKGGTTVEGFPLFDTVEEAVRETGANVSVVFVPPAGAADAAPRTEWVTLEETERRYVKDVLRHANGRVNGAGGAAEILGLKPSTLQFWIDKLGLREDLRRARAHASGGARTPAR